MIDEWLTYLALLKTSRPARDFVRVSYVPSCLTRYSTNITLFLKFNLNQTFQYSMFQILFGEYFFRLSLMNPLPRWKLNVNPYIELGYN